MPSGDISLMAPKAILFYSDITMAKLVSFTQRSLGMFLASLPWGVEYCETDFRLNGGRPVNKPAPTAVLWK